MPVARRTVRIETDFLVFNTTTDKNGNFKYFLPGRITRRKMNSIQIHVGRDSPRVSSVPSVWRVAGSNPTLATTSLWMFFTHSYLYNVMRRPPWLSCGYIRLL